MYLRCVMYFSLRSRCRTSPDLRRQLGGCVGFIALEESQGGQGIGVLVVVLAWIDIGHVRGIPVNGVYSLWNLLRCISQSLCEILTLVVWRFCVRRIGEL